MGIVLNEGQVMLRAIPSLNNARNDLQEASNDARSLLHKLPSSFSQRGLVSDIANKLSNAKGEVDSAKSLVNSKVSTAKSIEGKNSAKASLLALLLGAKGGFVTGATTANKARGVKSSSYSRTGAATANKSNNIFSKIFGGIKKAGSALFSGGKTVVKWLGNTTKAVINRAKSVGAKIASGTKSIIQRIVPSTKQVIETVKKVGTKIIDGVKTVGKWAGKTANTIVSGAKSIGTKIVNGFKTVGRWAGDAAKNISKVVKKVGATAAQCVSVVVNWTNRMTEFVLDTSAIATTAAVVPFTALFDVGKGLFTGNWDWSATKGMWKGFNDFAAIDLTSKAHDAFYSSIAGKLIDDNAAFKSDSEAFELSKKAGATATQISAGLTEGVVKFGESIVDAAAIIGSGIGSIGTGIADLGAGIFTGNWEGTNTKTLWNSSLRFVGTDWSSKLHDSFYDGSYGKQLDQNALFTSESGAFNITKNVGYVAALVVATIFTCGAASAGAGTGSAMSGVISSAAASGAVTAASSLGVNAQENYQTVVDEKLKSSATKAANSYKITDEDRKKALEELKIKNRNYNPTNEEIERLIREKKADEYKEYTRLHNDILEHGDISKINLKSSSQAAVEGLFAAATAGASRYIGNASSMSKISSEASKLTDLGKFAANHKFLSKTAASAVKSTRSFVTEGIDAVDEGREYNLKDAATNAGINFAMESAINTIGNGKPSLKTASEDIENKASKMAAMEECGDFIPEGLASKVSKSKEYIYISSIEKAIKDNTSLSTNMKNVTKLLETELKDDFVDVLSGRKKIEDLITKLLQDKAA